MSAVYACVKCACEMKIHGKEPNESQQKQQQKLEGSESTQIIINDELTEVD